MHAVGKASVNQPYAITLSYSGSKTSDTHYSLIGKGLCFDSGGLDIKPPSGMDTMYLDKSGAISAFCAFKAMVETE